MLAVDRQIEGAQVDQRRLAAERGEPLDEQVGRPFALAAVADAPEHNWDRQRRIEWRWVPGLHGSALFPRICPGFLEDTRSERPRCILVAPSRGPVHLPLDDTGPQTPR